MAIAAKPIYANDITAGSTPSLPLSVETRNASSLDRPLAHGWLTGALVEPGFGVYAARYDTDIAYAINTYFMPGFSLTLNLGEREGGKFLGRSHYLPSGNFGSLSFDEILPAKFLRGERKHYERCGISFEPGWIEAGKFERFDDTGIVAKTIARRGVSHMGAASPALLSVASRLFAAFDFEGPLADLRREAAALAFFAEAFAGAESIQHVRPASRFEAGRIMRVKETLDGLAPDVNVRLIDLAAYNGMSVRSLCRHFRMTFGTTVSKYVAERRMDKARVSLERDGATIDQAAYIAGFAHTSNFSSAFRIRFGYPPGKGRRK